jgi:hypothetical protein
MALPATTLRDLPANFWGNESQVNGVWNNLLSATFTNNFVTCPENIAAEGPLNLRADLNIVQINPPPGRSIQPLSIALTFEGKRQGARVTHVDDVIGQLQRYAANVPAANGNFYCIAAYGRSFKIFVKTGSSSIIGLSMRDNGGKPTVASRTGGATAATRYDIITNYNALVETLRWIAGQTFPLTTDY